MKKDPVEIPGLSDILSWADAKKKYKMRPLAANCRRVRTDPEPGRESPVRNVTKQGGNVTV